MQRVFGRLGFKHTILAILHARQALQASSVERSKRLAGESRHHGQLGSRAAAASLEQSSQLQPNAEEFLQLIFN